MNFPKKNWQRNEFLTNEKPEILYMERISLYIEFRRVYIQLM